MFERLQKPFLTVETGEAYQPVRISYALKDKEQVVQIIDSLKCCVKNPNGQSWNWFWRDECNDLHFESLDTYKRLPEHPLRLGTLMIRNENLYINLPSFKRACLGVPFFHNHLLPEVCELRRADFINKVFGTDERLPHGFTELFKEDDLEKIIQTRLREYETVQKKVEEAVSAEEAFNILADYTRKESKKRLPYAERYLFDELKDQPTDIIFLSFYVFLRGRELVAIHRWFGETGYTVSDLIDETIHHVFGDMDIDIIE